MGGSFKAGDNEQDKRWGRCGGKVREVDDGVWELGKEPDNVGRGKMAREPASWPAGS